MTKRAGTIAVLVACGVAAAGCGGPPHPTGASLTAVRTPATQRTPVQAALAWFVVVNQKNKAQVDADMTPAGASQWDGWKPSAWPTFTSVKCRPETQPGAQAAVYCTFSESQARSVANRDTFWSLEFQRHAGRWLITNYGQG